jgi:hypothetical protein
MRPLRYSINVTLDGCCDHEAGIVEEEMHRHAERGVERADALILGRVTYQLMEDGWRSPSPDMPDWMASFAPPSRPHRSTSCRARWRASTGTPS